MVISHVHYVTEMEPGHAHHAYYRDVLPDFDARLRVSILGRPDFAPQSGDAGKQLFPDIRQRFEPYLGWLDCAGVLALRFEDFLEDRQAALGWVLDHAVERGFPLAIPRAAALQALSDSIDPRRSPTFRSGKAGGWRERFSVDHKHIFKEVTGDLLVRLGYEQDDSW